jgi:antitoxin component YwqK of YwqJK toxin-antitoxin module
LPKTLQHFAGRADYSSMTNEVRRPAGIPDTAYWDQDDNEWVVAQRNGDGEFHGVVTYYRPDGTRCCATQFVDGTAHGPFSRFHENQELSRTGTYVNGTLHGTNVFTRSTAPTTENFPRGLGANIWRCEMDYVNGSVTEGRLYDRAGGRVKEDGDPFPQTRPAGVPSTAHYRKPAGHDDYLWVAGAMRDNDDGTGVRVGRWQYWSEDGELVREETYDDNGELTYDRPANVPSHAELDTDNETWTVPAPRVDDVAHGDAYVYSIDGVLRSSETYRAGQLECVREYLSDGSLGQDSSLVDGGVPRRKWFRRTPDEELDSFPNVTGQHPSALEVEYLFDAHGMMTGYTIRGDNGAVLESEQLYRDAGNAEEQARFGTIDEAARAWTAEGDRYTHELNKWLAELYDTGEPSFDEPTFDRRDLERAVIDGVVALNERGQGALAHRMFPLYHDGIGKAFWHKYGLVVDRVLHTSAGVYARIQYPTRPGEVVRIADNRFELLPGVLAFGASPDKRALAFAYDDRIEVHAGGQVKALSYPTHYQHRAVDALGAGNLGGGRKMSVHGLHVLPNGRDVVLASGEGIYLLNGAVNAAKRLYPLDTNLDAYVESYGDEPDFALEMSYVNADVSPTGDRITCGAMFKRGVMAGLAIYRSANGDWVLDQTSQANAFFPIQAVFHRSRPHIAFAACLYASLSNQLVNTTFRIDLDGLQPGEIDSFGGGIAQEQGVVRAIASFGDGFLLGFDNGYVRWMGVADNCELLGYVFVGGSITQIDVHADGRSFTVASDAGVVSTFRLAGEASRNLISTMPLVDEARYGFFRTYPPLVW